MYHGYGKLLNDVSVYEGVTMEDDVFCGPSVVFTNVKYPIATKKINKKNYEKTLIKRGATLGANSTILCGVTVGKNSLIGAGSVITKNVKKDAVVIGNPGFEIEKNNFHKNRMNKKSLKKKYS